jgi:hypothetical protein
MRTSLRGTFRMLACSLAMLALPQQGLAGDTTNAALITDSGVWAQSMHQVMGGTSTTLPGGSAIRGPAGIYAIVQLSDKIPTANKVANSTLTADQALTNYFSFLLANPAVSGLMLMARWKDMEGSEGTFAWNYLDDASNAIDAWNKANPFALPKTLQLVMTTGFNSPDWLFTDLDAVPPGTGSPGSGSCDGLFLTPAKSVSSACGYTTIFQQTESGTPAYMRLPLPWNPTYKSKWQAFLVALNAHITSDPTFVSGFVSIAVAGPTASSAEIILPNGKNNPGTLTLPSTVVPSGYSPIGVDVFTAWNCLLGNNYGVTGSCLSGSSYGATSSYINSDRAFVEEWAAAIDMFGQVFSGVTLTVATGSGLPEFPVALTSPLLAPPPAFAPDCGTNPTMDCAAEAAILGYFAGPSVGGANAKSTEENGLRAIGINGGTLSGASVKWLSQNTSAGLTVLPGSPALVSRMLGGLQLAKSFSLQPAYEGCLTVSGTCTPTPTSEQALLKVLAAFFAGISAGFDYGASTTKNGSAIVANAPINYLQIYDDDFLYAAGLSGCSDAQLMSQPPPKGKLGCQVTMTATVVHDSKNMTAQDLLNLASQQILGSTEEAVILPPPCCPAFYVPRGAFQGDSVCVLSSERSQVLADNAAAAANYATNYTSTTIVPNVPYGICKLSLQYRQAYMGDYVCVSSTQANQVMLDNAAAATRSKSCTPPPPPRCVGTACY